MSGMVAPLELGLCVADLDEMVRFYEAVLGCHEVTRATLPAARTQPIGLGSDDVEIVWMQTMWGERIKLLRPNVNPAAVPVPAIADMTAQCGVAYLTFYVDDLDARTEHAMALGATALTERLVTVTAAGVKIAFFRDPEGTIIELVERSDLAAYRPDLAADRGLTDR